MTNSLEQSEQSNKESTERIEQMASCPSCSSSEIQDLAPEPSPVCSECGFVLGTEADIPPPIGENETESNPTDSESWCHYHSVSNSTESQVASAFDHLQTLGDALLLSDETRSQVADVYATAALENLTDGRSTRRVIAAAICIGARESEAPRPSERVAEAAELPPANVKRTIRVFQQELNRGYTGISASGYVPYLCDDIDLNDEVKKAATELIEDFHSHERRTENHPAGIAGAAIYIVAENTVTQRQIAKVAGVTKETIRVRIADLREVVD